MLNLFQPGESNDDTIIPVTGDACHAADVLATAGLHTSFDVVFSNSLIGHVGGPDLQAKRGRRARPFDQFAKPRVHACQQLRLRICPVER